MTLQNKEWYYSNTIRFYLSGYSQEAISNELQISEGKINEILREFLASDDTLAIQHEIAVVSKKTGTSIKQLAVNMSFANAIRKMVFDKDKIQSFLQALNLIFNQDKTFSPEDSAKKVLEICDFVVKNGIELKDVPSRLKEEQIVLDEINIEIFKSKKLLLETESKIRSAFKEHKVTRKDLQDFVNARAAFEEVGMDFKDKEEVLNVLYSIQETESDPKTIVDELKKIRLLGVTLVNLEADFARCQGIVERLKARADEKKMYLSALTISVDLCNKLIMGGFDQNNINNIFQIISGYPPGLAYKLANDIQTYGDLEIAIYKMRLEFDALVAGIKNVSVYNQNEELSNVARQSI